MDIHEYYGGITLFRTPWGINRGVGGCPPFKGTLLLRPHLGYLQCSSEVSLNKEFPLYKLNSYTVLILITNILLMVLYYRSC